MFGKYRAPSLRNIALTAPYMHDGSITTLGEMLDHFRQGGRIIEDGPYAGDRRHPALISVRLMRDLRGRGFDVPSTCTGDFLFDPD